MRGSETPMAVIRARDLDTDDEVRTEFNVPAAFSEAERLRELVAIVRDQFPAARQKSFAGNVASFVDPKHLIVARYVPPATGPRLDRPGPTVIDGTQTALFSE